MRTIEETPKSATEELQKLPTELWAMVKSVKDMGAMGRNKLWNLCIEPKSLCFAI